MKDKATAATDSTDSRKQFTKSSPVWEASNEPQPAAR